MVAKGTHRLKRRENVMCFLSRADSALLYFAHGFDVALELGGEQCTRWRDIGYYEVLNRTGGENGGEGNGHSDFPTPGVKSKRC